MPRPPQQPADSAPGADDLIRFVGKWRPRRIVVAGDYMLDRYVFGNADRLSPDAPVPVLATERTEARAGGAANVCLDLRALRCDVACLGVVGRDDAGRQLRDALKDAGCKTTGVLTAPDRPTTVKHSFIGLAQHRHPQKMFRVDDERRTPLPKAVADKLLAKAESQLKRADALCIEDYNKGVFGGDFCQRLIKLARRLRVPVLVDPAAIDDFTKYAGASCLTPNRTEAALATGQNAGAAGDDDDAMPKRMAKALMRKLKLDALVLTLDKQGALLTVKGKPPVTVPTRARAVYDVTGAGDMVLAVLAASVANGADWHLAVQLANVAAGLEVEKFGVVPIALDEIMLALLRQRHEQLGKVRTLAQLLPELQAHRAQGRRIAFTNGCFDILHAGHVSYLRQARRAGDLLVVGLNSDASIKRIKGEGRPVNHQPDRVLVLSELESIDYIVVFNEDTPTKLIQAIRPDALVKGGDYTRKQMIGHEIVEAYGGDIVIVPMVQGRSTTNIIRKIADG